MSSEIDYTKLQRASAVPEAAPMIETFRAIGYSVETAIADIIDNSISAGAKNVWIKRIWRGGESVITIKDDGCGMTDDEIKNAMRPGSKNPLEERASKDLGRFGLGLKTASFSQCRKLSVLSRSKKAKETNYWTWDLDFVARSRSWDIIRWLPDEFKNELDDLVSGTLIVWTDMDRVVPSDTPKTNEGAKRSFSTLLDRAKRHIAMTFHRFIESKRVKIFWGASEIEPWNPFFRFLPKTQEMPEEDLNGIRMQGFILPHKKEFKSGSELDAAGGLGGWVAMQGFYVYRNDRLLLAGSWLNIRPKREQYKLVRISIDLPNNCDAEWQIDIKKSKATPPALHLDQLRAYSQECCNLGEKVYKNRGEIVRKRGKIEYQPLWLDKKTSDGKWSFVVNREHQMVLLAKKMAKQDPNGAIDTLLRLIENALPTRTIYIKEATDECSETLADEEEIEPLLRLCYEAKIKAGIPPKEAKQSLKATEPFNHYEEMIDEL